MTKHICFPFFRPYEKDSIGGSYESTFQMASVFPSDIKPTFVFSKEGKGIERAKSYGLDCDLLKFSGSTTYKSYLKYMYRVHEYLMKRDYDIIHVNDMWSLDTWGLPALLRRIPIVWHIRGEYLSDMKLLSRSVLADHCIFVANSHPQRIKNPILNTLSYSVVHNGVDTTKFSPKYTSSLKNELNIKKNEYIIGFVGNLVERKRPLLFQSIAERLLELRKDTHFIYAGAGGEKFSQKIENRCELKDIKKNVHLLGFRDDIPNIMAGLDILLMTSTETGEAFPRVPIEAMACGVPVVTTNTAGVSEAVHHGKTGFVLDTDSPDAFSEKINELLNDNEKYEIFSQNAINLTRSNFSIENKSNMVRNIYNNILIGSWTI